MRFEAIDHESHLVNGHPVSAILDLAESTGAHLIVVGSRGLGMASDFCEVVPPLTSPSIPTAAS